LGDGIDRALDLAREIGFKDGWHLSPGGGWGVSYHEDDLPNPPIEMYVRFITANLKLAVRNAGWRFHIYTWSPAAAWWPVPRWQSTAWVPSSKPGLYLVVDRRRHGG